MNTKIENINKRNWQKINYGKTRQFLVLLDKSVLNEETQRLKTQNRNKEGAKFRYSDGLIEFIYMMGIYFKMDLRKLQTFCLLFGRNMNIPAPDYTTINRRVHKLNMIQKYISKHRHQQFCVIVDASGMHTTNRGEWLRCIHKKGVIKSINGFVKFLISVDADTQEICGFQVFNDSEGETKYLMEVLLQAVENKGQPIDVLFGDGAYDSYNIFEMLKEVGITPIINIHNNADLQLDDMDNTRKRRRNIGKTPERTLVARGQLKDKDEWKRKNKYGRRWIVESVFSAFKRMFGQDILSKNKKFLYNEMMAKVNLYNLMKNC